MDDGTRDRGTGGRGTSDDQTRPGPGRDRPELPADGEAGGGRTRSGGRGGARDGLTEGIKDGIKDGLRRRIWGSRSSVQKIDAYSRFSLCLVPWVFYAGWALPILLIDPPVRPVDVGLSVALGVIGLALCLATRSALLGSLDRYLGKGDCSRRSLVLLLVLTALMLGTAEALVVRGGIVVGGLAMIVMFAFFPVSAVYALRLSPSRFVPVLLGTVAGCALVFLIPDPAGDTSGTLTGVAICAGLLGLASTRPCAWSLAATWEVERAKETEARLAVAEERLRFGRDLHDVLGRNLAVIALKSELAVQLARRGKPEAVEQMVEVQRIARDSQREVREVVRGYRGIDLGAELLGARSVLEAAGIECESAASATEDLPAPVQAALAWVVREAATNVLRHGDARHCAITLATSRSGTSLTVENDGVPDSLVPSGTGSGLAGLRERLGTVAGTLEAAPAGPGRFRLCARVPAVAPVSEVSEAEDSEPAAPAPAAGPAAVPGPAALVRPTPAAGAAAGSVARPAAGPAPGLAAGSGPGPRIGSGPYSGPEPEPEPNPGTRPRPVTAAAAEVEVEAEVETEAVAEADVETEADTGADPEVEAGTEAAVLPTAPAPRAAEVSLTTGAAGAEAVSARRAPATAGPAPSAYSSSAARTASAPAVPGPSSRPLPPPR
ncbi:sensor histidine kinase [Streptomyces sp. NPDC007088]|uniref:sensor histidine kinase n=1 Tax=Streptomyces sp. NPDC007088 TaxID=3364773 RepID=UPI00369D0930